MHLVGYNLIRELMATAAFRAGVSPWTISFKGAMQTISNLAPLLTSRITTIEWCDTLLDTIATHEVGNRPDRVEPRVVKRRPKPYKLMTRPRHEYKRRAAQNTYKGSSAIRDRTFCRQRPARCFAQKVPVTFFAPSCRKRYCDS